MQKTYVEEVFEQTDGKQPSYPYLVTYLHENLEFYGYIFSVLKVKTKNLTSMKFFKDRTEMQIL